MKRRRRIHCPKRYQVIAFSEVPLLARSRSTLTEAPRFATVLGVKDGAVADDPSVLRVEESHLAERERHRRHRLIVRPRAIGLQPQHGAGQTGGNSLVAA